MFGGLFTLNSLYKYSRDELATLTVLSTSTGKNSIPISAVVISCGGMKCVIYPVSSLGKASALNPLQTIALEPKLELEFVIEWSPPLSATK